MFAMNSRLFVKSRMHFTSKLDLIFVSRFAHFCREIMMVRWTHTTTTKYIQFAILKQTRPYLMFYRLSLSLTFSFCVVNLHYFWSTFYLIYQLLGT